MSLWVPWWNAIWQLRPAFSRLRSFLWFATAVAGFTVRTELLGVTSLVRALKLDARFYNKLVDHFHSPAVKLDRLTALWTQTALRLFPQPLRINGRYVVVGDGIKVPKRGRKMPGVKLLHQQSESNTKPEYIMGHSMQAVSLLVHAATSVFAVPLAVRIHEGVVWSNRDRRTLLDKMLALLGIVAIAQPCYFVADAYYAARKIVAGLLKNNNHLVTRVKSNAVAYTPYQQRGPRKRGRPKVYDRKVKLKSLLQDPKVVRIPRRRQAQAARLPCLHPGGRGLPGTASVPGHSLPAARLGLLRLLAAHHPARHPALRAGGGQCAAPDHAGISPEFRPGQQLREIRHRATGQQSDAGVPARVLTRDWARTLDSRGEITEARHRAGIHHQVRFFSAIRPVPVSHRRRQRRAQRVVRRSRLVQGARRCFPRPLWNASRLEDH